MDFFKHTPSFKNSGSDTPLYFINITYGFFSHGVDAKGGYIRARMHAWKLKNVSFVTSV